jgi:Lon protease-like protein
MADFLGEDGIGDAYDAGDQIDAVPLFPLPGVVLFPGAILPLHVFERRYRQMTRHALDGDYDGRRLLGICRVRDGADPMDDQPTLFEVGCIGGIIDSQQQPDGRFNLLVRGLRRIHVRREHPLNDATRGPGGEATMYRRADLEIADENKAFEIDLRESRDALRDVCRRPPLVGTPIAEHLERMFNSSVPTVRLADVLAFDLLEDVDEKQALLEETDVRERVEMLATLLDRQFPEADSLRKLGKRFQAGDEEE